VTATDAIRQELHPEDTAAQDPRQQRIFDVLVEKALAQTAL
jgi:hypothetical protein